MSVLSELVEQDNPKVADVSSTSTSSDCFENFLSSIKPQRNEARFRLSNGSLSDFIANSSSPDEESCKPRKFETCRKPRMQESRLTRKCRTEVKKKQGPKISVVTPRHIVIFSSDSDSDEVFYPRSSIKHQTNHLVSPSKNLSFTDSDKENQLSGEYGKPKNLRFSSSESDDHRDLVSQKPPEKPFSYDSSTVAEKTGNISLIAKNVESISLSDSENENFSSLKDRLLSAPSIRTMNNDPRKCPLTPVIQNKKEFLTPFSKPNLKPHHTEKVNRTKTKICSVPDCFLSSLDSFASENSGTQFKKSRDKLTKRLFNFFNATVFDHMLPETIEVSWSNRMTKTAGVTKCKRERKTYGDGSFVSSEKYEASIVLSEKVIDRANRLRDTLIHEMCHAAVWVINNVNEGHGQFWKSWACKARRAHPELPIIDRCHHYSIEYKYRYQCVRCSTVVGRHSKSIDTSAQACGKCFGKLVLLNKGKGGNPFSNFVKDNYRWTKAQLETSTSTVAHRDIMKSLSDQFKAVSLSSDAKNTE